MAHLALLEDKYTMGLGYAVEALKVEDCNESPQAAQAMPQSVLRRTEVDIEAECAALMQLEEEQTLHAVVCDGHTKIRVFVDQGKATTRAHVELRKMPPDHGTLPLHTLVHKLARNTAALTELWLVGAWVGLGHKRICVTLMEQAFHSRSAADAVAALGGTVLDKADTRFVGSGITAEHAKDFHFDPANIPLKVVCVSSAGQSAGEMLQSREALAVAPYGFPDSMPEGSAPLYAVVCDERSELRVFLDRHKAIARAKDEHEDLDSYHDYSKLHVLGWTYELARGRELPTLFTLVPTGETPLTALWLVGLHVPENRPGLSCMCADMFDSWDGHCVCAASGAWQEEICISILTRVFDNPYDALAVAALGGKIESSTPDERCVPGIDLATATELGIDPMNLPLQVIHLVRDREHAGEYCEPSSRPESERCGPSVGWHVLRIPDVQPQQGRTESNLNLSREELLRVKLQQKQEKAAKAAHTKQSSSAASPSEMAAATATAEQAMHDLLLEEDAGRSTPAGKKKSKKGKKKKNRNKSDVQVDVDDGESAPMTDSAPIKMGDASSDTATLVSCDQTKSCWKCKAAAQFQCGRCKSACYCGPKCQATDWKKHKGKCIPVVEKGSESLTEGGSSSGHASTTDSYEDEVGEGGGGSSAAPSDAPAEFTCLLTHVVMQDPVVDPEGNTYERHAIEQWLQVKPESPVTRAPMTAAQLAPNRALKSLIQAYLSNPPGAASEPPADPAPSVPERIQALEAMWGIAPSKGSYIRRIDALEALIGAGQCTEVLALALPARIAVLEQYSGLA
jgi:hypothetical protein